MELNGREGAPERFGSRQLEEIPFAVVDVETTGTSVWGGDRITEIAVVHLCRGDIVGYWDTLVYPERPIPRWITGLTGISDAMVYKAPPFRDVADRVNRSLGAHVFVGHNAGFDWRFVSAELERAWGDTLAGRRLCTVRLARVFLQRLPSFCDPGYIA
ncbi:MAG: 3'-5' exonuclease [Gemmatimonadaceae bacterium]